MNVTSPVQDVAPALLVLAAKERTWGQALGLMALTVTAANVEAFRCRATALGIDVSHLRWRRVWADIDTDELRQIVGSSSSYAEVLAQLGSKPGGRSYRRLEE